MRCFYVRVRKLLEQGRANQLQLPRHASLSAPHYQSCRLSSADGAIQLTATTSFLPNTTASRPAARTTGRPRSSLGFCICALFHPILTFCTSPLALLTHDTNVVVACTVPCLFQFLHCMSTFSIQSLLCDNFYAIPTYLPVPGNQ